MGIHISLPTAVQALAEEQIADGGYTGVDDYVAALIWRDARQRAQEKLEALLLEGLEGEETPWTEEDSARLRRIAATGN